MKRFLTVILDIILLFACASAEIDYSSMTADELVAVISRAGSALLALEAVDDDPTCLYDRDGVKINIDYLKVNEENDYIKFGLIMINDTDGFVSMEWSAAVNGWTVNTRYANSAYCDAGLKTRDAHQTIYDICKLSGISSFAEIKSIEVKARVRVGNDYHHMRYIIVYEDGQSLKIVEREYLD